MIVITAHGTIEAAVEAMKKGAVDFIQKPIFLKELLIRVERLAGVRAHKPWDLRLEGGDLRDGKEVRRDDSGTGNEDHGAEGRAQDREMWKVFRPFLLVLALIVVAPLGYVVLEGWGFPEAFYMSLITITTVGFGEVKPLSEAGRFFTSGLIIFGIGTFTYALSTTTSKIVEGRLNEEWKRKKMMKRVERMRDHYIICGVGSTGKWVIREFLKAKRPFVVIEHRHHHLMELLEEFPQLLWIEGDATEEEVLLRAGIKRTKGLLALLSTDAENLFLIITSKGLNPDLHIISRAKDEKSIDKLLQGGADRVVSPAMTEGTRIASLALRPDVMSFLDVVVYEGKDLLVLEEVAIPPGSGWIGRFIGDMDISRRAEALLLGIKLREKDKIVFNPSRMTLIEEGDKLILLGTEEQLECARQLILQGP